MSNVYKSLCYAIFSTMIIASCQSDSASNTPIDIAASQIHPEIWPLQQPVMVRDEAMEQRINDLLAKMTIEEKVGQLMQPDIASVTPQEVKEFNIGSVLNGGGSAPDQNLRNTPDSWLALADEFWEASTDTSDGGVGIPAIWGTDAVHGHSNIVGATLFPHNIGLGAANDPDLLYEIGRVTALEMLATGLDWTFAPTIAVVRNDRWGRTYEGYSEDPAIVASYAPRIIEGLQGKHGTDEFLNEDHLIATAKHFVGDGGTDNGVDQGNTTTTEEQLREIHAAAYPPAIAAGAQTVMASYNSFHGRKMHGVKPMLTDVLVGRMGFDGFVVGDWNGHGQVRGCNNESCADSFNAGLDMFMVPEDWEDLYENTLEQVQSGEITQQRLDEAVARILRVKLRAGVFEAAKPSERKNAGNWELLAAPEHKAIAREAVRKSLVLLKNENGILPLAGNAKVLVAGDGANDIGKQSGGWTLSWQGTGNTNEDFPNATSIFDGIQQALGAEGGQAILSENGKWKEKPDVAIVVFGEDPYAEGVGDRDNVDFDSDKGLDLLKKLNKQGIPTISVFISGRAMWVNPELNLSDAFVAAWLPGSEGGGIADVLIGDANGNSRHDFHGRLSYSWPATADQVAVNVGDTDYQPLFPYGYGLSYTDNSSVEALSEDSKLSKADAGVRLVELGHPIPPWIMVARDATGEARVADIRGSSPGGTLNIQPADDLRQEDTFIASWQGPASLLIQALPEDVQTLPVDSNVLEITYKVLEADISMASITMGGASLDLTDDFKSKASGDRQTSTISLSCFNNQGIEKIPAISPLIVNAEGQFRIQVSSIKLTVDAEVTNCDL